MIQVGKSSLPVSACISWLGIQVSSPDEGDKPAVELGIFTVAQEKDMLNKGQLKKKVRDSKALYFNSKNIKVVFNGLELVFKPMQKKKKPALINLYCFHCCVLSIFTKPANPHIVPD